VEAGENDTWGVKPDPGFEIVPTAEATERLREWRRRRDALVPPGATCAVAPDSTSARDIDPVLARALDIIPSG
jgi:hypothetical protein